MQKRIFISVMCVASLLILAAVLVFSWTVPCLVQAHVALVSRAAAQLNAIAPARRSLP